MQELVKSNKYIRRYMQNNFILLYFKLFSIGDSFKFKATDLVTRQRDSRENVKEFVMTSPHVMPHPIVSGIVNMNPKCECKHVMRT